ncbi:glycoside hydrolase family 13 protein [Lachnoanaerobaculum umeaense]|uniref:Alpha-glucosidase n=1 Tax=Lachnoanaerobaculum umeaense TaxID=617123 RepID=A0A385Q399_9FIRM|nr:alpha-glucosidase [Lachnoanaerobaculum umeaense]AYB00696.1 alpha-glucosidase [Lachnoanaerobaculum umeaense]PZW95585.1 oligo-1,6-glucosidase [Lachnoanaerobaculum umeaense]
MKKAWWKEAIVYQIYPRSFYDSNGDGIGDLNGITSKLDYLKELGIDVIWLSPVYKSPNDDNGYDISDYEDIMTEFGNMEDFDKMLSAAHERGIKIVMDLVVNHTSDEHPWFVESRSSKDNEKRDYYIWKDGKDGKEPTNWGSAFSGPAWKYDEKTDMYYLHLFSVKQPDLNWENPKVRKEVFDMMTRWCEKGIDGFRMDVISLISKPEGYPDAKVVGLYGDMGICANGPKVHDYLKEMNEKVLSKFDIMTVGETAGVTLEEAKKYANSEGNELNMVFQFEHTDLDSGEKFKWSTKPMPLVPLKENLSKWQKGLDGVAWNSLYFCNHDQPRIVSRLGDESDEFRELSAKCIATCLHMMQGTPYVYQGEELGMTNTVFNSVDDFRDLESINAYRELVESGLFTKEDMFPKIAHKSRDNARTPMQWDASENAGFTTGTPWIAINPNYKKINVADQLKREDSVFHYYKKLIRLRKENEIIVYGKYELLIPEDDNIFAYTRSLDGKKLLTVCNFSKTEQKFDFSGYEKAKVLISNYERDIRENSILKPYEAVVLLLDNA